MLFEAEREIEGGRKADVLCDLGEALVGVGEDAARVRVFGGAAGAVDAGAPENPADGSAAIAGGQLWGVAVTGSVRERKH